MTRRLPALLCALLPLALFAADGEPPLFGERARLDPAGQPKLLSQWVPAAFGAGGDGEPLPPDVAFRMSAAMTDGTLVAHWTIAPGHYLYRTKFSFRLTEGMGVTLGPPAIPAGEEKEDETFGRIRVFHDTVEIRVPVERGAGAAGPIQVEIGYQGCAEAGICYPPTRKQVRLEVPAPGLAGAAPAPVLVAAPAPAATTGVTGPTGDPEGASGETRLLRLLHSDSLWTVALAALAAGLLMAFTACMYPMIPILSTLIVGQGERISPARGFVLSLAYVTAVALTFGVVGGVTALAGGGVGIQASFQSPWLLIPFALLFVALAFALFGFYDLQMPGAIQGRLGALSNRQRGGTLVGAGLMGLFSALIVGPCGGPFLIGALAFAASSGSFPKGFAALFMLGFGMGLPLLLVGLGGGALLPRAGEWMKGIKSAAGVVLLGVALLFLERMPSIFPPLVTMLLWATLLIVTGIYLGALEPIGQGVNGWRRLRKGMGVALVLYGTVVMLGGLAGGTTPTDPLRQVRFLTAGTGGEGGRQAVPAGLEFKRIKSVADLQGELAAAKAEGRAVMLDFYADWCTYCKEFEAEVFSDPGVKAALGGTLLLQADVTANDAQDQALMKAVGVVLPPAILFFDANGAERSAYRVVGFKKAGEFRNVVERALPRP